MNDILQKFGYLIIKKINIILGLFIIFIGILAAPLPLPFGLPLIVMGTIVLLKNSLWAKRGYIKIRLHIRKNFKFIAFFWQKVENLIRNEKFQRLKRRRPEKF